MAITAYIPGAANNTSSSGQYVVFAVGSTPSESRVFAETIDFSRAQTIANALNATL